MAATIIYRILRKRRRLRAITRSKATYVVLFFLVTWLLNSVLFYYSEHVVAGREEIDVWASMYWSIITMATIGYGDITPVRGLGWVVAGFAAIMGILAYTLTVSVIADWFLSKSMKRSLGMAPLKNKKIIVIGGSDSCREIIDELVLNGLEEETGWVTPIQPRGINMVDYLVGDPSNEETLAKAGIDKAKHVILCIGDDSKTIHTALLVKHLNPKANIYAITNTAKTEQLLRQAGVKQTISAKLLGRTIASAVFEPHVLELLTDMTTARGTVDLIETTIKEETTVNQLEEKLDKTHKCTKHKALLIIHNSQKQYLPSPDQKLTRGDYAVLIKTKTCNQQ